MKLILLLTLMGISFMMHAQTASIVPSFILKSDGLEYAGSKLQELKVKYDTTILNAGDSLCQHDWAKKNAATGMFSTPGIFCAVYHGLTGCPDKWLNENQICTICLRHINIKETRWTEPVKDRYAEALDRLNKLQNKKE